MGWQRKNNNDKWDTEVSNEVTVSDELRFKKTAEKVSKSKKTKRIVFWSLSAVVVAGVITLAVALPKNYVSLKLWNKNAVAFVGPETPVENLNWNKGNNIKVAGEPYSLMLKLLEKPTLENEILASLNIQINPNFKSELVNPMLDLIQRNALHFDVILTKKDDPNSQIIVRNFTIYTQSELGSERYNEASINKFNANHKIGPLASDNWELHYFTPIEFKPSSDNPNIVPKMQQIIDSVNSLDPSIYNYIDRGLILLNKSNTNRDYFSLFRDADLPFFFPFDVNGNLNLIKNPESGHYSVNFNAMFFSVASEKVTVGKNKYEYGIYTPYKTNNYKLSVVFNQPEK
ncbi:hypothetical protein [Metamycoplasma neophronis]|uniref:Uncharacterized protein n=1 Tax=Metamycoplasma neophronis TaxID=872983 RepID=A0ABY2YZN1_9BACT|nr:hypothetical protein [Metamycoplasma neophronis]TPR53711.1 hypothetical protein FJR74_02310 [Metamycoplasma neophronis]